MLKSIVAAAFIGVLGGSWIALVNGSVELFQNYVDGVWRYQVGVRSFAAPVIGAVIGALAGANIRLALAQARTDGFVRGALAGFIVGALLVAAQAVLVALAALLEVYDVEYGFLLTRFLGILTATVLIGAIAGLLEIGLMFGRPVVAGAVVGALVSVAFVLPAPLNAALNIPVSDWGMVVGGVIVLISFVLTYHLPVLLAGIGSGAIIGAVHKQGAVDGPVNAPVAVGIILGAVAAVTASSLSFHYVILGLESSPSSFSIALVAFRTLLGLVGGCVVGLVVRTVTRRIKTSRYPEKGSVSRT